VKAQILLAALVLGAIASPAGIQNASPAPADRLIQSPQTQWIFDAFRELDRAGRLKSYASYLGAISRKQAAACIEATIGSWDRELNQISTDRSNRPEIDKLKRRWQAPWNSGVSNFKLIQKLFMYFADQWPVEKAASLQAQLRHAQLAFLSLPYPRSYDRDTTLPTEPAWIRAGAKQLRSHGRFFFSVLGYDRLPSRYDMAMAAIGALDDVEAEAAIATDLVTSDSASVDGRLADLLSDSSFLVRATHEYESELTEIKADLPGMERRVNALQKSLANAQALRDHKGNFGQPFSDVPASHWAARTLMELRSKGLIAGYPDGTFRGD